MRCGNCNKKCIPLKCTYCTKECCSSCIQLEIHECSGMELKCKVMLDNLQKSLPQIVSKKHNVTY